jgi:hypothetical protein
VARSEGLDRAQICAVGRSKKLAPPRYGPGNAVTSGSAIAAKYSTCTALKKFWFTFHTSLLRNARAVRRCRSMCNLYSITTNPTPGAAERRSAALAVVASG